MESRIDIAVAKDELRRINEALHEPRLLIGGLAVNQYVPSRISKDIDLVCEFGEAIELIGRLYPAVDWNIEDGNTDEFRPSYRITNRVHGDRFGEIQFGPKILERRPYDGIRWDRIYDGAEPFVFRKEKLSKILVPTTASLAFTKLLSFIGRYVPAEDMESVARGKVGRDLRDFGDLTNHPDFSLNQFYDLIRQAELDESLANDVSERLEAYGLYEEFFRCSIASSAARLGASWGTPRVAGGAMSSAAEGAMRYDPEELSVIDRYGWQVNASPGDAERRVTNRGEAVAPGCLFVVDVQNDFMAGGPLSACGTETLLDSLNGAINAAQQVGIEVVYIRDWHPESHWSFKENGGPWPSHAVEESEGAAFPEGLEIVPSSKIFNIGTDNRTKGYSPFESGELEEYLGNHGVSTIFVAGIALEYCISATCLDAIACSKTVIAVESLIRPASARLSEQETRWKILTDRGVIRASELPSLLRSERKP
ncbi:MAG: isochorismatase family protein [Planctomycetota bacterium]